VSKRVVIIGGVACGGKVASRLRRLEPETEILMLEKGEHISYAACGLPFYVGGTVSDYKDLINTSIGVMRDASYFKAVKNVNVLTSHMVTSINKELKNVEATDLCTGERKLFSYDYLVIATGASPIIPPIPGNQLEGIFKLWTLDDAIKLRSAIDRGRVKRAVIVGGGLVGLEAAEAMATRGIETAVVDLLGWPLPAMLDEEFGAKLKGLMASKGVMFYGGEKVTEIVGNGCEVVALRTDKREMAVEAVLLAVGVKPNAHLATETGLEVGQKGGILVDEHMRTSDPYIYAGGDVVETRHIITNELTYQPMGSSANRQGRVIADNIAGIPSVFKGVVGTAIMRFFDFTVARTGLSEHAAKGAGFDPVSVIIVDPDKPHFMPGSAWILARVVADRRTRRLLGAQFLGPGQVDKRLDAFVAAVTGKLTVDDLADADFGYAPPYSTALDPLTHAANALRNKMDWMLVSYSPSEFKRKLDSDGEDVLLLDVRTPAEVKEQGRLPYENQVNIPLGQLRDRTNELPADKEIVTFCKVSVRGWDAYNILRGKGFKRVALLEGGIVGWPYEIDKP
jgi:NADPH-dependent 2,4-dienoyl-CoA reductase/sulfur reductase-like enzyme/rhodanese-related sulfurtransferase